MNSGKKVKLHSVALMVIKSHAYSTENEEIAGLLAGVTKKDGWEVHIALPLQRIFKSKDRVELLDQQLIEASQNIHNLSQVCNFPNLRVLGWYHSHPHICVWPSHVDLQTQANYQLMDRDFLGIIVSVYSRAQNQQNNPILYEQSDICAFQSIDLHGLYFPIELQNTLTKEQNTDLNTAIFQQFMVIPELLIKETEYEHSLQLTQESLSDHRNSLNSFHSPPTLKDDFTLKLKQLAKTDHCVNQHLRLKKEISINEIMASITLPMHTNLKRWSEDLDLQIKCLESEYNSLVKLKQMN